MAEKLIYSCAFETSREKLIVKDLDASIMPCLHEIFAKSKDDLAKAILASKQDKNTYQFVLTVKQL